MCFLIVLEKNLCLVFCDYLFWEVVENGKNNKNKY